MADRGGSGLAQLTLWRFRELWREPEALFWVFARSYAKFWKKLA